MRIFLIGPSRKNKSNWGFELFRKDLGRFHDVIYYGEGYNIDYNTEVPIPSIIKKYQKPDIILVHLPCSFKYLRGIEEVQDIPKVHIMGDYIGEKCYKRYAEFFEKCKFDLVFAQSIRISNIIKKRKIVPKIHFLPFGVDTSLYKRFNLSKEFDVMAVFSSNKYLYPYRKDVLQLIRGMEVKSATTRVFFKDYIQCINKSKIFVNSNNIPKSVSMKYTEVLSCGTFFLSDKPTEFAEHGYTDNKHLVIYNDMKDLKNKINYFLEHVNEREQIAEEGMKFVRENYSNKKIIEYFTKIIKQEL